MKLTTQEEYGLRCLLQIARLSPPASGVGGSDAGSLTIPEVSKREGISAANVAKIMRVLRKAGFVRSIRGQSGGYALARAADQIVVSDVIARLGSPLYDATFCQRHSGVSDSCAHLGDCSIRPVLRHVQDAIDEVLDRLTLASLLRSEREVAAWTGARGRALPVVSVTEGRDAGN